MLRASCIALLIGCGSASGPPPALPFLRVGVDPAEEADAMVSGLVRGGWEVARRVSGRHAVVVSLRHEERGESTVRVVTRRGIALTVDVPGEEGAAAVGIAEEGVRDVDGDGREEVFLWRADPVHARKCHAVLRVDDAGNVSAVPARIDWLGERACLEALRDLDGDGTPEAIAFWRLSELVRSGTARVPVPLALGAEALSPAPSRFPELVAAERAAREREAAEARAARDVVRAYEAAVELAALERVRGGSVRDQVTAFDAALSGLVLDEREAADIREARERIASGW